MRKGFTLTEVLLTLAIIGVVAALTIPAVITKVTQDQYVVGLKKAYNTLKSVEREAIQEHGEMANWDWTLDNETSFEKYFKPCFDILKDCGATTDDGCFPGSYLHLNNDEYAAASFNTSAYPKIMTSDGISYSYGTVSLSAGVARRGSFFVDVNGKKPPNKSGRDFFVFHIFPDMGIKPNGSYSAVDGSIIESGISDCTPAEKGQYCAAKVLAEGAMNY